MLDVMLDVCWTYVGCVLDVCWTSKPYSCLCLARSRPADLFPGTIWRTLGAQTVSLPDPLPADATRPFLPDPTRPLDPTPPRAFCPLVSCRFTSRRG